MRTLVQKRGVQFLLLSRKARGAAPGPRQRRALGTFFVSQGVWGRGSQRLQGGALAFLAGQSPARPKNHQARSTMAATRASASASLASQWLTQRGAALVGTRSRRRVSAGRLSRPRTICSSSASASSNDSVETSSVGLGAARLVSHHAATAASIPGHAPRHSPPAPSGRSRLPAPRRSRPWQRRVGELPLSPRVIHAKSSVVQQQLGEWIGGLWASNPAEMIISSGRKRVESGGRMRSLPGGAEPLRCRCRAVAAR